MPAVTQERAKEIIDGPGNVFVTGGPGRGKSYLINSIFEDYNERNFNYLAASSTGISAEHIGGYTVHSLFGLGSFLPEDIMNEFRKVYDSFNKYLDKKFIINSYRDLYKVLEDIGDGPLYKKLVGRIEKLVKKHAKGNLWHKVKPLVSSSNIIFIDEISMIGDLTLLILDATLRIIYGKSSPFGGVKIIIVGDVFQLTTGNENLFTTSPSYWAAKFKIINLMKNYRADDDTWNEIQNKIRTGCIDNKGNLDPLVEKFFQYRLPQKPPVENITHIVPLRRMARDINKDILNNLSGDSKFYSYKIKDEFGILNDKEIDKFFKNNIVDKSIELKIGSYVMTTVNDNKDHLYRNGTQGVVVAMNNSYVNVMKDDGTVIDVPVFRPYKIEKKVKNKNKGGTIVDDHGNIIDDDRDFIEMEAIIYCLPIIHARGVTVHKTQGMTLDRAVINLNKGFSPGQSCVAFSRVKSMEGVFMEEIPSIESLEVSEEAKEFVMYKIDEFDKYETIKPSVDDIWN